jgi:prepilin-type N-terminal cleavage/methylation domain-containing protein
VGQGLAPVACAVHACPTKGFSLTELLGVLAILGIFAGILVPAVVRRADRAAWIKETYDMGAISNAITLQILRDYSISNQAGWATPVANWTKRTVSQVSTNNRRFARLFFYDQGGWMANTPFIQTNAGTGAVVPLNARIAIVSTIAKALPYTNGPLSTPNFNSIWNSTQGTKPSFFSSWTGNPDDLVVQRVTLDPLFHRLILCNRDKNGSVTPAFSINSTNTDPNARINVLTGGGSDSYYLDGSTVCLWVNGTLTNRFVLTRDTSRTFEAGQWGGQPSGSGEDGSTTAQDFVNTAKAFISTAAIPGAHSGSDTQGALSAFYTFMYAYTLWANGCPHFQYITSGGATIKNSLDWVILDTLGANGVGGSGGSIINGTTGTQGGGLLH